MPSSSFLWDSRAPHRFPAPHPQHQLPALHLKHRQRPAGNVPVGQRQIQESSVLNAGHRSHRRKAGDVPAERSTKENSVLNAVQRNRQVNPYISVTSVDGSRKTRKILPNSVRNAGILLTREISSKESAGEAYGGSVNE